MIIILNVITIIISIVINHHAYHLQHPYHDYHRGRPLLRGEMPLTRAPSRVITSFESPDVNALDISYILRFKMILGVVEFQLDQNI